MPPVRSHKVAAAVVVAVVAVQVAGEPGAAELLQAAQPAGLVRAGALLDRPTLGLQGPARQELAPCHRVLRVLAA